MIDDATVRAYIEHNATSFNGQTPHQAAPAYRHVLQINIMILDILGVSVRNHAGGYRGRRDIENRIY